MRQKFLPANNTNITVRYSIQHSTFYNTLETYKSTKVYDAFQKYFNIDSDKLAVFLDQRLLKRNENFSGSFSSQSIYKVYNIEEMRVELEKYIQILKEQYSMIEKQKKQVKNIDGKKIQTPCKHDFHEECFQTQMENNSNQQKGFIECFCQNMLDIKILNLISNSLKGNQIRDKIYENQLIQILNHAKSKHFTIYTCNTCVFKCIKDKENCKCPYCEN